MKIFQSTKESLRITLKRTIEESLKNPTEYEKSYKQKTPTGKVRK